MTREQCSKSHPTCPEKAPERSGKADAEIDDCASRRDFGSYGDPVLERWRPGGSVWAIIRQGSQAYLSLAARLRWR